MIEYYLFMHKGGQPQYQDGVVPIANPELSIGIIASSKLGDQAKAASKMFKDTLGSDLNRGSIMDLAKEIDLRIPDNAEYIIFRISDNEIESMRRGNVYCKIVKDGEMKVLPNGIFKLEDEDRIVCATEEFFSFLPDEAILADSLFAESCQEWMNYMVRRISDINWLSGNNMSAVTLIVRSSE